MSNKDTKHTPGPWIAEEGETSFLVIAGTQEIANVGTTVHSGTHAKHYESKANARLIAAAPELLAVLKEIMSWEENADMTWGPKAFDAIAKAEGGK